MYIYVDLTDIKRWWIGANDKDSEGHFTWVFGKSLTYANCDEDQPVDFNSNGGSSNADCVLYFFRRIEQSCAWFDRTCDTRLASICENTSFM